MSELITRDLSAVLICPDGTRRPCSVNMRKNSNGDWYTHAVIIEPETDAQIMLLVSAFNELVDDASTLLNIKDTKN